MAILDRRFKDFEFYQKESKNDSYHLMPFNWSRIEDFEILTNIAGDFLTVPKGTVNDIVLRKLDKKSRLYQDLMAKSFISHDEYSPAIDLLATRYRTKKSFLDSFTGLFIFVASLRCEHTCNYCQVSRVTQNKDKYDITEAYLEKGIEIMLQSPNKNITMEFQGGESLLAFDKIKFGVLKAKEKNKSVGKKITFVICTNLSLINQEILDFCKYHNILISTSLDGPKHVHDTNRNKPHQSSYDLTIKGINSVRKSLGNDGVSALMTTSKYSLDYPEEIVDEYVKQGFNGIFIRNISPYGFATRGNKNKYESQKFLQFYKRALDRIFWYNKNGHHFTEDFTRLILQRIFSPFSTGFVDLQSPAGMVNSVLVFNYNGEIYATDESRMLAEMKDFTFRLGHLDKDDLESILFSNENTQHMDALANEYLAGCSDCSFQPYCGSDPVYHHATQGDSYGYRPNSGYCQKNMGIFEYIFKHFHSKTEESRIMQNWL